MGRTRAQQEATAREKAAVDGRARREPTAGDAASVATATRLITANLQLTGSEAKEARRITASAREGLREKREAVAQRQMEVDQVWDDD